MTGRRPMAALAVLVFTVVGVAWAAGPSHAEPGRVLCGPAAPVCHPAAGRTLIAAPSGPHPVGRIDVQLTAEQPVMVSAWYPATVHSELTVAAPYIPATDPAAQLHMALTAAEWLHTPAAALSIATASAPAAEGAPVDGKLGRLPVLVVSPGLGTPRWILSGLAADLASRGYVVVVLDHPGESPALETPDGQVQYGSAPSMTDDYMRDRLIARVQDVRMVMDQLPTLPIVGPNVDLSRVAVAGHSYGGYTALTVAAVDPRIRAVVVLDGSAGWHDGALVTRAGVVQPVLLMALGDMVHATWTEFAAATPGPFSIAAVRYAAHYTATDLPALGGPPELCGTLAPVRAAEITRGLVADYLAHELDGQPVPDHDWPEVEWPVPVSR